MTPSLSQTLKRAKFLLASEPNLIQLPSHGHCVFVGDTHGDVEASKKIIARYLDKNDFTIVFLGDYVDRGPHSGENVQLLLSTKLRYPTKVHLLQGNHEAWYTAPFQPADFRATLDRKDLALVSSTFSQLPLAASADNGLLATHAALPDIPDLFVINRVQLGDENWRRLVWADWQDTPNHLADELYGRPQLGPNYFFKIMKRLKKTVLVRSHQPHAPLYMYDKHCLTIFTSCAYGTDRTVAITNLTTPINSAADITIKKI